MIQLLALLVLFCVAPLSCQEYKSCGKQIRHYEYEIQKKIESLNLYQLDTRVDAFIDEAVPFLRQLHIIDDKNSCLTERLAKELVALEKKYMLTSTFVALVLLGDRRQEVLKRA